MSASVPAAFAGVRDNDCTVWPGSAPSSGGWLRPDPTRRWSTPEKLRRQWFRGHQIRATVALLSFALSVVAVVS